jgi:hypothetical protein
VDDCEKPVFSFGRCGRHYRNLIRRGDPLAEPVRGSPIESRFWQYVTRSEGCWEWQGARDGKRYGVLRVDSQNIGTHRVSWVIANGPIPDGLFVCHTCDNPPCVNPAHLFLGTNQDNQRDASQKGRLWRQRNWKPKVA